ncbi:M14 family zinc carboxypeptidase [Sphingobacterium rhinopitheci]|uniref:M14 family zinc carboxypeptidase n=1 Tax=Sphingobacterium rhinopitheci TaxID=2781960 RepID=UPI001F519915|nr:M14 family zinc carboxypeptidase [Sphingobacterium rhinopitheci]MCI0920930.1 peptidase M14 [Sphingobacterium rhinopitheci]
MKKIFVLLCSISPLLGFAQLDYPSYKDLLSSIHQLKGNKYVSIGTIGKSFGGENISVVKLERDPNVKPTLLLVSGIDGKHPAGVISSVGLLKELLAMQPDSLAHLLDNKSIWIVPLVNPDAYKRNVEAGHWNSGNARVVDNDRDGRMDENPSMDINGDALISQMRVKSIAGTHVMHPNYKNILIEADRSKGEKGNYVLFDEGIDTDFDDRYGEDGVGGVNLDRNFTFNYPAFYPESGNYAASEPETKALMNFVYENPQISTIVQFGLTNNLSEPERFNEAKANERIVSSWTAKDADVAKYISSIYKKISKPLGEPTKMEHKPGNFANTAYYHLGKYSFSTPIWWPSVVDSVNNTKTTKGDDMFYQWAIQNNIDGAILPWVNVKHPNFPNNEVEVGGIVDIYRLNPPLAYLGQSTKIHADFIQHLLKAMPQLEFQKPEITALGADVFRVELAVTNVGLMPMYPEIADKIKYVSKFKTICELQKDQVFLNGKRLQLYPSLGAGKSQTFSWLIKGKGTVTIIAGCPTSGIVNIDVKL